MNGNYKQEVSLVLSEVCVPYLCKFNKAVVSLRPHLILSLIGHDITDLLERHEHTFFIVLHRSHDDVCQVLHQLNLKLKHVAGKGLNQPYNIYNILIFFKTFK